MLLGETFISATMILLDNNSARPTASLCPGVASSAVESKRIDWSSPRLEWRYLEQVNVRFCYFIITSGYAADNLVEIAVDNRAHGGVTRCKAVTVDNVLTDSYEIWNGTVPSAKSELRKWSLWLHFWLMTGAIYFKMMTATINITIIFFTNITLCPVNIHLLYGENI